MTAIKTPNTCNRCGKALKSQTADHCQVCNRRTSPRPLTAWRLTGEEVRRG